MIRSWNLATWIGVGVVLCDLVLMGASYGGWHNDSPAKARLAFEKKIRVDVPADARLFATPEIDAEDIMVVSYRLRRQIERRPIVCARRNDRFLTVMDELAVGQAQVLVALENSKIALVRVLEENPAVGGKVCQNLIFSGAD